jgi:hypothetical protein
MQTYPLVLEDGHLFVNLAEATLLFDTGAPTSFGRVSPPILEGQRFNLPSSYMGLTAELLSNYVGRKADGILGSDILNQFDILIDVPQSRVSLSNTELACDGEALPLEFCMNVPILAAEVDGNPVKMFFDTGAQISYLQDDSLSSFQSEGGIVDFYPGLGQFSTETFRTPVQLGRTGYELRCGQLPSLLGMTLMLAGTSGIVGNEILRERLVGYFPRRRQLILS